MPTEIKKAPVSAKKDIDLSSEQIFSEKTEKKATKMVMESETSKSMVERVRNHEGGTWIMYNEALSDRFGESYAISILPIEYNFQKGFKTWVLDEHEKHIWNIFNRSIRARGLKIVNDSEPQLKDEDPTKMMQG